MVHAVVVDLVVVLVVNVHVDQVHLLVQLLVQDVELLLVLLVVELLLVLLVVELLLVLLVVELLLVLLNVVEVLVALHMVLLQVLFQLSNCPTSTRQLFQRRLPTLQNKPHTQTS